MSAGMTMRFKAAREKPSSVLLDHELSEICSVLQERAGVVIDRSIPGLAAILQDFLRARGFASAEEMLACLHQSPADCGLLLNLLLPGDTAFFRPVKLFEIFQNAVLPEIALRNHGNALRGLRICSVGCSTGEEAYSIAAAVCEALAGNRDSWNVHIVAGDIRPGALEFAERGRYPATAALHVPRHILASYFSPVNDHLQVKPRLRNLVSFTQMNVTEPAFIGRFHCIFCVDVLPQLSVAGKASAWQRLQLALEPGGYIFLGEHDEMPAGASLLRHCASVYQRPLTAAASAAT